MLLSFKLASSGMHLSMANSLCETLLQRIMVVVFIVWGWSLFSLMKTTTINDSQEAHFIKDKGPLHNLGTWFGINYAGT